METYSKPPNKIRVSMPKCSIRIRKLLKTVTTIRAQPLLISRRINKIEKIHSRNYFTMMTGLIFAEKLIDFAKK
jgi:hypothetical protein